MDRAPEVARGAAVWRSSPRSDGRGAGGGHGRRPPGREPGPARHFCLDGHVAPTTDAAHLPRPPGPGTPGHARHVGTVVTDSRGDRGDGLDGGTGRHAQRRAGTCDDRDPVSLVGPDARPTLVFDRGGWSPAVFARGRRGRVPHPHLQERRKTRGPSPRSAFVAYDHVDDLGHAHTYHLAGPDRVRLATSRQSRRRLAMRQVTRLGPVSAHQTQVLTTHSDWAATEVAQRTFDAGGSRTSSATCAPITPSTLSTRTQKRADDLARSVPNPAKAKARAATQKARALQGEAEKALADAVAAATGRPPPVAPPRPPAAINGAAPLSKSPGPPPRRRSRRAGTAPARVRLATSAPTPTCPPRTQTHQRTSSGMAAYNAQSVLARASPPITREPTTRRTAYCGKRSAPRPTSKSSATSSTYASDSLSAPAQPGYRRPLRRTERDRDLLPGGHRAPSRLSRQGRLTGSSAGREAATILRCARSPGIAAV